MSVRRLKKPDPSNIPGDLIQDDLDFKETYEFVLALRGASIEEHPAAWEEKTLTPAPIYAPPNRSATIIEEYINLNTKLGNEYPGSPHTRIINLSDDETTLPIPTVNMAKAFYFRWHYLQTQEYKLIVPPVFSGLEDDHPLREAWVTIMEDYLKIVAEDIIGRFQNIATSIVLANIQSYEFQQKCRLGHFTLARFFFKALTNDQLYYIYGPIWSAVDFSFIQGSDTLPDSPSELDLIVWDLRKFAKSEFGSFAAQYFEWCLQRKALDRHDSKQLSEAEKNALASSPGFWEKKDAFFNSQEEEKRYTEGFSKVLYNWSMSVPFSRFFKTSPMLPAARHFMG
ncbi:hypothetical protein NHQ30_000853 [Ciborinia camelliae]|nr:hypothetical protein NHQ30_000853 [Ciborinia camelliae]